MKKITLTLVLTVLFLSKALFGEEPPAPPIKFTIETERSTYATSDRIILKMEVENISNDDVDVVDFQQTQSWILSAQVVTFEIKDAQGNDYPMEGSVVDYWPGDRVTRLSKGGKMSMELILNNLSAQNYFTMGRQSTYTITAYFNGWNE